MTRRTLLSCLAAPEGVYYLLGCGEESSPVLVAEVAVLAGLEVREEAVQLIACREVARPGSPFVVPPPVVLGLLRVNRGGRP